MANPKPRPVSGFFGRVNSLQASGLLNSENSPYSSQVEAAAGCTCLFKPSRNSSQPYLGKEVPESSVAPKGSHGVFFWKSDDVKPFSCLRPTCRYPKASPSDTPRVADRRLEGCSVFGVLTFRVLKNLTHKAGAVLIQDGDFRRLGFEACGFRLKVFGFNGSLRGPKTKVGFGSWLRMKTRPLRLNCNWNTVFGQVGAYSSSSHMGTLHDCWLSFWPLYQGLGMCVSMQQVFVSASDVHVQMTWRVCDACTAARTAFHGAPVPHHYCRATVRDPNLHPKRLILRPLLNRTAD